MIIHTESASIFQGVFTMQNGAKFNEGRTGRTGFNEEEEEVKTIPREEKQMQLRRSV